WIAQLNGQLAIGSEIQRNGLSWFPVRRNLQDGRAAQAAMSNQHFFTKVLRPDRRDDLSRNSSQIAKMRRVILIESKRHQSRPRLDDLQPKLPRQIVTKACSAHLGDRQAARSDDQ